MVNNKLRVRTQPGRTKVALANVHHLTRVINFFTEVQDVGIKSDIYNFVDSKDSGSFHSRNALHWLVSKGLVIKNSGYSLINSSGKKSQYLKGVKFYRLNPLFKKILEEKKIK